MREDTTQYALLGLLSLGPATGYELAKTASGSLGHFWSESYGQLYPGLQRLRRGGLVRVARTVRSRGPKPAHVWALTAAGKKALAAWLGRPPGQRRHRNELLLKLFFGRLAGRDACRQHVVAELEAARRERAVLMGIQERMARDHAGHPDQPYWSITLAFGLSFDAARIAWGEETLHRLDRMARRKPGRGRARARAAAGSE